MKIAKALVLSMVLACPLLVGCTHDTETTTKTNPFTGSKTTETHDSIKGNN